MDGRALALPRSAPEPATQSSRENFGGERARPPRFSTLLPEGQRRGAGGEPSFHGRPKGGAGWMTMVCPSLSAAFRSGRGDFSPSTPRWSEDRLSQKCKALPSRRGSGGSGRPIGPRAGLTEGKVGASPRSSLRGHTEAHGGSQRLNPGPLLGALLRRAPWRGRLGRTRRGSAAAGRSADAACRSGEGAPRADEERARDPEPGPRPGRPQVGGA